MAGQNKGGSSAVVEQPQPKAKPDPEEYLTSNGWRKSPMGWWDDPAATGKTEKVQVGTMKLKGGGTEPLIQTVGAVGPWRWSTADAVTVQEARDKSKG